VIETEHLRKGYGDNLLIEDLSFKLPPAGIVGVIPDPLTLRELRWMARGRQTDDWDHTARLLAKIHNVNQVSEESLLRPIDFHPFYDDEEIAQIEAATRQQREKGSVAALAALIVGKQKD
jgi:hypothetical protein